MLSRETLRRRQEELRRKLQPRCALHGTLKTLIRRESEVRLPSYIYVCRRCLACTVRDNWLSIKRRNGQDHWWLPRR
jgi:hypothetical protein